MLTSLRARTGRIFLPWFRFVTTNVESGEAAYRPGVPRRAEPDPEALVIGQRIRQLREQADLGLEELAHAADFSKGHLSNLERGYVMPTVAILRVLADALEVLVADLVIDPEGSDREKLFDLTRSVPKGTIKKLVKDLALLQNKKKAT
jgi:transcriptional regulator with XRE-family HTH domain